jgi:hypothetical protein
LFTIFHHQTAQLAVFSAIAKQKCLETLRTVPPRLCCFFVLLTMFLQVQQLGYIATCGARRFFSSLGFFALVQVCVFCFVWLSSLSSPSFNVSRVTTQLPPSTSAFVSFWQRFPQSFGTRLPQLLRIFSAALQKT